MNPKRPASRKREAVQIGRSSLNQSDLKGLRTAWQHGQLALFLGAGTFLSHGIPAWKNLPIAEPPGAIAKPPKRSRQPA